MIPIELTFQAFESYAEKQTVNFKALSQNGIFLIHGETGAGKSAILDAITFALYHETSGGKREQVRCFYKCAEKIPTIAEFTFSLGETWYRFTRTIRKKRNRSDSTTFKAEDYTSDHQAMILKDGEWIPLEANPTKTSVTRQAEQILGLTAEQFRQIIILPQGQFERFLTSESGEKEEILTTLFAAEKYTRITQKIQQLHLEEQRSIAAFQQKNQGLLESAGVTSLEELEALVSETSQNAKALTEEYNSALLEADKQKKLWEIACLASEKFSKRQELSERLETLSQKIPAFEALEKSLKRSRQALSLKPLDTGVENARREKSSREKALQEISIALEKSRQAEASAAKALAELKARQPAWEETEKRIISLKEKEESYSRLENAKKEADTARASLNALKNQADLQKQSMENTRKELKGLEQEEQNLQALLTQKLPLLAEQKNQQEEGKKLSSDLIEYQALYDKLSAQKSGLEKDASQALEKSREAHLQYEAAMKKHLSSLSAQLAASLTENAPCPVCGSIHHPAPAESAELFTEQELETIRQNFEDTKQEYSRISLELEKLNLRLQNGEQKLNETKERISALGFSPQLHQQVNTEYDALQNELKQLPEVQKRRKDLNDLTDSLSGQEKELSGKLLEETARCARADSEHQSLLSHKDPEFENLLALRDYLSKTQSALQDFKGQLQSQQEALTEYSNRLQADSARKAAAEKELSLASDKKNEAAKAFHAALSENGFSSREEWLPLCISEEILSKNQQELTGFFASLSLCRSEKSNLDEELSGKTPPDINELKSLLSEAEEKKEALAANLAVAQAEEKRLLELLSSYQAQSRDLIQKQREASEQENFARLMVGNKSQSFTRFVLGIRLDEIVSAANLFLRNVLGGQFQLYRKTEGEGRNKKTGLELEVLSALASTGYSVKNLSGGEKFLLSLSLSMALSSTLINRSGGMSIDALFIDEGFGSLDSNSLKEAMSVLSAAVKSRGTVGIISHVSELTELIPVGLEVSRNEKGSKLSLR